MTKYMPSINIINNGKDIELGIWSNVESERLKPIFQTTFRVRDLQEFGTAFAELNRQLLVIWEQEQMQDSDGGDFNAGEVFDINPF